MINKLDDDLFSNDNITFGNEDSNYATFLSNEIVIFSVDLNDINFDDINFDEDRPETIISDRLMAWCNRFKQSKLFKKDISKESMPVACHTTKWWDKKMKSSVKSESSKSVFSVCQ